MNDGWVAVWIAFFAFVAGFCLGVAWLKLREEK